MDGRCKKVRTGISLIESMIAILILAIVIVGAAGYRFASMLDVQKASVQAAATRAGLFILESWRGTKDQDTFVSYVTNSNATNGLASANIAITTATGPAVPTGFTQLGNSGYKITVNGFNCFATLAWKDLETYNDTFYGTTPRVRQMCIVLNYPQRGQQANTNNDTDKSIILTSYKHIKK